MIVLPEYYKDYHIGTAGYEKIDMPSGLNSHEYLEFSLVDMEKGNDDRSNINAISNAKRAFHLQIEILSKAFGIEKLPKQKKLGFHNQLSFCQKCGLTSPNCTGARKNGQKKALIVEKRVNIPQIQPKIPSSRT